MDPQENLASNTDNIERFLTRLATKKTGYHVNWTVLLWFISTEIDNTVSAIKAYEEEKSWWHSWRELQAKQHPSS